MLVFDIKKYIQDALIEKAENYSKENNLSHLFSEPIIGYASAEDPLFMAFYERGWTMHPKEIYRPGKTVVVHFLPFAQGLDEKEMARAFDASIIFSAILNDCIKENFEKLGRLASLTALPGDWNEETDDFHWSHKLAAFVTGMGEFGVASSFTTSKDKYGRFNSVLTEMELEPSLKRPEPKKDAIKDILQGIVDAQRFGPEEILSKGLAPLGAGLIKSCPAGAIGETHIDKQKCRNYCRSLGHIVPDADVCGRCFDPHGI